MENGCISMARSVGKETVGCSTPTGGVKTGPRFQAVLETDADGDVLCFEIIECRSLAPTQCVTRSPSQLMEAETLKVPP